MSVFRPPDWRYLTARDCVQQAAGQTRLVLGKKYDDVTKVVIRYLRQRSRHGDGYVSRRFPELHDAIGIYERGVHPLRSAVEARLLLGQSFVDIAHRTGLKPLIIVWYRECCFDIKDFIHARDYLSLQVVGPRPVETEIDYDLLWKLAAISGRADVLDALIGCDWSDTAEEWLHDTLRRKLLSRSVAEVTSGDGSSKAFLQVFAAYAKIKQFDRDLRTGDAKEAVFDNIRVVLDHLGKRVAPLS